VTNVTPDIHDYRIAPTPGDAYLAELTSVRRNEARQNHIAIIREIFYQFPVLTQAASEWFSSLHLVKFSFNTYLSRLEELTEFSLRVTAANFGNKLAGLGIASYGDLGIEIDIHIKDPYLGIDTIKTFGIIFHLIKNPLPTFSRRINTQYEIYATQYISTGNSRNRQTKSAINRTSLNADTVLLAINRIIAQERGRKGKAENIERTHRHSHRRR
jgi:hypothetical protein